MDSPSEKENLKSSVSDEKEDKLLASNEGHKMSNSKHSSDSEYESAEEDQNIVDDEGEEIEEILTEEVKKVGIIVYPKILLSHIFLNYSILKNNSKFKRCAFNSMKNSQDFSFDFLLG